MKTVAEYGSKLDQAIHRIKGDHGDEVVGIFVIGSITQEVTPTSDCDVAVIFRDRYYADNFDSIRERLRAASDDLNRAQPDPELVLWPTKQDHYVTLFPDVSYIRRNLPDQVERLDAWCGLAKFTLLAYESAASRRVHGEFELPLQPQKVPRHECLELFLLSTRTLAEGLVEMRSADASVRQKGINHVAKAGLRAAYAATVRADQAAHNTYKDIFKAASRQFPEEYQQTLQVLFDAKTKSESANLSLEGVFALIRHCEGQIADTRRQTLGGLTMGRAGESFGFDAADLSDKPVDVADYSRFAKFTSNNVHSLYFLMSAREVIKRLSSCGFDDENGLDLFFEEVTTLAAFGVVSPQGVRMVVGQAERSVVEVGMGLELLQELVPLLSRLAVRYLEDLEGWGTPWLSQRDKLVRLRTVLLQLAGVPGIETPAQVLEDLSTRLDDEAHLDCMIDWQFPLLKGLFSPLVVQVFAKLGLTFYQSGQLDRAERLLEQVVQVSQGKSNAAADLGTAARAFDQEISKAHHYLAITYARQGENQRARGQYERALALDPDNFSALDDFAVFLLENDPPDQATARLLAQLDHCREARGEAEEQVSNRFHNHAIDLKVAGDFDNADFFYAQTIALNPRDEKAYYNFGRLKEQVGDFQGAAELYARAIEVNPDYLKPYLNLGVLFEQAERFDQAIALLSIVVERGIADQHVLTNLGNCCLAQGDLEAAGRCYEEALVIDANFANALGGKGSVLLQGPNASDPEILAQAAECFRRAFVADPTFAQAGAMYERLKAQLEGR